MNTRTIIISNLKFSEVISLDKIVFVAAHGSYCEVLLKDNRRIMASKNLKWFEQSVDDQSFFRAHKSYIINMKFVCKIFHNEYKIELRNGSCVPLSRNKKIEFWERLEALEMTA